MAEKEPSLIEIRCTGTHFNVKLQNYVICNRVLGKVQKDADYQIICPRCGTMNEKEKTHEQKQ